MTTSGAETVLHGFGIGTDGNEPDSAPVYVNGELYGTTVGGGANDDGTVYSITTGGSETVLHSFDFSDGLGPSGLIDVNGVFYGTTGFGGPKGGQGHGTVYSITPSGAFKLLGSFNGGGNGSGPRQLLYVNGLFYGTAGLGGSADDGTIFSVTPSGKVTLLHTFTGSDGEIPNGPLLDLNGVLYGTTAFGGANREGTAFSLSL